jgi:hypothetical protein
MFNNPAAQAISVRGSLPMFSSQPAYEFPFPPVLGQPGSRHGRTMELSLQMPSVMMSVDNANAINSESSVPRTLYIALDHDLAEFLRSLVADRVGR